MERYLSGIEGLDQILRGGFIRGSAYIVQGAPGAGKTILANQFCFSHAAKGGRALYVSLLTESHHRMIAYMQEFSFFDRRLLAERITYISAHNSLRLHGLEGLLELVREETKRSNADVIVLDGVFVARGWVKSDNDYRRFIHELQGVATSRNGVLLLLTHPDHLPDSIEHTMVDGWISLQYELNGAVSHRSLQVPKQRGSRALTGKHAFRLSDAGFLAFPRLESTPVHAIEDDSEGRRLALGVPGLDLMLAGGLPARSATLVMGPTGAGKTTLGLHFLAKSTVDAPALLLSFYETPIRLQAKARAIGIDFSSMLASGALHILWYPPVEFIVDEIAEELLNLVRVKRISRVFIDGVVPMRDSLVPPGRLPGFLNALNRQLRNLGATVVYSSELRQVFLPDKLPSDEISAMIDNLIILTYAQHDDLLRRQIAILKLRDSTFDTHAHEIYIGETGLNFGVAPQSTVTANAGS